MRKYFQEVEIVFGVQNDFWRISVFSLTGVCRFLGSLIWSSRYLRVGNDNTFPAERSSEQNGAVTNLSIALVCNFSVKI
jgi:hypothetical protein